MINCCKIVSSMIWKAKDKDSQPTGADEFLSVLIFILLKAKPKRITSNISFIRDFRSSMRLKGEGDYYFTAFDSAVRFVENLNRKGLKIDEDEYNTLFAENSARAKETIKYRIPRDHMGDDA